MFFAGFLAVAAVVYSSIDYYSNLVKNAQYEKDIIKKARMQTDITITNITNTTTQLNLTLKNTGKITLYASAMNVFINGNPYNYTVVTTGNVWVPQNSTNITIPVSINLGDRIKITTENGVSDYRLK
ncbi:MAG: hypothetical protein O8C60_02840 [Candidatus Methanoperedens sp.]|nr:hypothetical protein [Candidatus Methanoperedens sp.]